jgi:1-acyl-sn-glycerol-3-phosphate acyltransferase
MVFVKALIEALFRLLFAYDAVGEENIPSSGGAVVAANHPSYLDPVLLSLQIPRPIRFMAWDKLFRVPIVGVAIRAFGAFPVDIRKGQGRVAYEKAKELVAAGQVVGIFPEGKRSRTGWMEPTLREGAARLAWELGVPLVPATITGAFRAWPYFRAFPRATRIRVRFHEAIDPRPLGEAPEEEAIEQLLAEVKRRVDRTLLPGVKADLRTEVLYRSPAPPPRTIEWLPSVATTLLALADKRIVTFAPIVFFAYFVLDWVALPQFRFTKRLRNVAPILFALAAAPAILRGLGRPTPVAAWALLALMAGASTAYFYERSYTVRAYVAGFVSTVTLGTVAQFFFPSDVGPHVTLPVFAAAFAFDQRTVFWRWSVPILILYAVGSWVLLAGGLQPWPHAAAGLGGWLLSRLPWTKDGSASRGCSITPSS